MLLLLITPTYVISQDVEPTLAPTPTLTDTPPFQSEDYNSIDQSETFIDATGSGSINTGNDVTSISSDSAVLDIKITTDNTAVVNRDTDVNNSTGGNNVSDNISTNGPITLTTGDAESSATIATILNTNVVGLHVQPIVHNLFTPLTSNLNLSGIDACQDFNQEDAGDIEFNENTGNNVQLLINEEITQNVGVYANNDATINNTIDLTSNTGSNTATDNIGMGVLVQTGNATSTTDVSNIANTNLIGNCGLFAVVNIFDGGSGSLILPYEKGYIGDEVSDSQSSTTVNSGNDVDVTNTKTLNTLIDVTTSNEAQITTEVNSNTNTGDNTIEDTINFGLPLMIDSGDNNSTINQIDMANMSFVDNNFLYLRVNHFGNFKGSVIGWDGEIYETEDYFILYSSAPQAPQLSLSGDSDTLISSGDDVSSSDSATFDSLLDVETTNKATITNDILLDAQTGDNSAGKFNSQINTGDASTIANILNLANTNIIGSNWYVAFINIFDDFFGDIIFPRPDLTIVKTVNTSESRHGDELHYTIYYANGGQVRAKDVIITDTLPQGVEVVSSASPFSKNGTTLKFSIGEIVPNQTGSISVTVRVDGNAPSSITNTATIKTSTHEPSLDNNTSSVTTTIISSASQTASPQQTIVITPTPQLVTYFTPVSQVKKIAKKAPIVTPTPEVLGETLLTPTPTPTKKEGSLLDGLHGVSNTLLLTALISYCCGLLSGIFLTKRSV